MNKDFKDVTYHDIKINGDKVTTHTNGRKTIKKKGKLNLKVLLGTAIIATAITIAGISINNFITIKDIELSTQDIIDNHSTLVSVDTIDVNIDKINYLHDCLAMKEELDNLGLEESVFPTETMYDVDVLTEAVNNHYAMLEENVDTVEEQIQFDRNLLIVNDQNTALKHLIENDLLADAVISAREVLTKAVVTSIDLPAENLNTQVLIDGDYKVMVKIVDMLTGKVYNLEFDSSSTVGLLAKSYSVGVKCLDNELSDKDVLKVLEDLNNSIKYVLCSENFDNANGEVISDSHLAVRNRVL